MKIRKPFRSISLMVASAALLSTTSTVFADPQFQNTENPIVIGPTVSIPSTTPTVVSILNNQSYGNAAPPTKTSAALPSGKWGKVILTITGSEKGRQYDRLMQMWAGNTQIFNGCTPEPTANGITWTVQKDVTAYLAVLQGNQNFTTQLANYVNSTYTGIPIMSATLSFYPEDPHSKKSSSPWDLQTPDSIVPLGTTPSSNLVKTGNTLNETVNLPNDITSAYLDLYVTNQNNDEFFYTNQPAFREVEVSIDGKPAGVVWPYPYIFTGGINPLFWRPITGIDTLSMPSYRLNLTPFAGLLGGKHTVSITVTNNQNYWLVSGSLFLSEDNGKPTTGSITSDTLTFPTQAPSSTTNGLDSSTTYVNQTANMNYQIQGTVQTQEGAFQSTVRSSMQYSDDQTNVGQSWQLVHGAEAVTTDDTLVNPKGATTHRHSEDSYTVDVGSGYLTSATDSSAYSIPGNVTQSLNEIHSVDGSGVKEPYNSSLYETLQGYGVLQRATGQPDVTQGATTAYANFEDSVGENFRQVLMARGGNIVLNEESNTPDSK